MVETTTSIRAALQDFATRIVALCGGLGHSNDSTTLQLQSREIKIHFDDECLDELDAQAQKLQNPASEDFGGSDMDRADASQIMDL